MQCVSIVCIRMWGAAKNSMRLAWMFELTGGALEDDCDKSCISRTQREAQYNCVAFHQSQAHIDDPRCRDAAEKVRRVSLGTKHVY
jgi:hypothetical protein